MKFFKRILIKTAASMVARPVAEYFSSSDWDNDDATALKEFLSSHTGKKVQQLMFNNSAKCCTNIIKKDGNLDEAKAESKAWLSLIRMLQMLTIQKKDLTDNKLSNDKLDEIFSNIVSNSSKVTGNTILGKF